MRLPFWKPGIISRVLRGESLHAFHCSLEDFAAQNERKYDLIFSNPPYFDCSLMAPEQRRNAARHTSCGLSYRELAEFASERLAPDGRLAIVLPADQENALLRHARMCGPAPAEADPCEDRAPKETKPLYSGIFPDKMRRS